MQPCGIIHGGGTGAAQRSLEYEARAAGCMYRRATPAGGRLAGSDGLATLQQPPASASNRHQRVRRAPLGAARWRGARGWLAALAAAPRPAPAPQRSSPTHTGAPNRRTPLCNLPAQPPPDGGASSRSSETSPVTLDCCWQSRKPRAQAAPARGPSSRAHTHVRLQGPGSLPLPGAACTPLSAHALPSLLKDLGAVTQESQQ